MKKFKAIILCIMCLMLLGLSACATESCNKATTVRDNIQKQANNFDVYRKMTFINLYSDKVLYSVEGYFSVQTTYSNDYQGQQEIGILIKTGANSYQMHYFSIANNVCYVIEQTENTSTNPYRWEIKWYVPLPTSDVA